MRTRYLAVSATLLICCLLTTACDDKRRHMPSDAVSLVQAPTTLPSDATPRQVVESILAALTDAQTARATGLGTPEKKKAYDAALARIFALAAKSDIHQQMLGKSSTVPKNVTPDAAMTVIAESWISQIAHYTGGFKLDSLRIFPETPQTDATVTIEAVAPKDREALSRIEFANTPKKPDGSPIQPGSTEYTTAIRQAAIIAGINVPVTAAIDIKLRKVDGAWRVIRITLSQGGRVNRTTSSPTILPTASN